MQLAHSAFAAVVLAASFTSGAAQPLVFLGDRDLRPYEFLENGQPRGASVDLAMAVGRELGRPVEVRLLDWDEAQERLLAGEGHALTFMARTPQREERYAFTQPTIPTAFALFVRAEDSHRFLGKSLAGKTIGVTQGGLARAHLQATHPEAKYVIVDTVLDGMHRLVRREIDAMAAQEWASYHLLNELGIRGTVGLDPFLRVTSNMATRKGDAELIVQLDAALQRVKDSGELERILDRWAHTQVHLVSERMMTTIGLSGFAAAIVLLVLTVALLWQRRQRDNLAREVQQRRALETDLRLSRSSLQQADHMKDQFLAMLGHELRNPLAPILQATQVIKLRGSETPDVVQARDVIDRQTRHLARLVDDLLDVSRIKTGKLGVQREACALAPLIQEALESCQHFINVRGHQVRCEVPSLWVNCDRVRIAQVLGNVLINAAKCNAEPTQIHVRAHEQDGMVTILVRDDGVGIRADKLEAVFELFHQERQPSPAGTDGLGIGLWLSRQIAELHGGTLTARSEGEGRGSEFTLTIPAAVQPQLVPAASPEQAPAGRRILVVDDNVDAAETLAMLLQIGGHQVAVAHAGEKAVELAAVLQPAIVFLDIGLPDIDGLEVCRRLRRFPNGKAMTIVAVTGWGAKEDLQRTADAGFDGHLTKPVEPEAIDQWIAQAQTRSPGTDPLHADVQAVAAGAPG